MDKFFAVISVARQIGGDYVFVRSEKAFRTASQADAYAAQRATEVTGADGKPVAVRISTPAGSADCLVTFGKHELVVE